MNILHVLHYPHKFGGLETFIESLVNNDSENTHFLAFFGKDKGYRLNLNQDVKSFSLDCMTEVVSIVKKTKANVLHLHWTGPESNNGKGVLCFLPTGQYTFMVQDGYYLDINSHPFGITQIPGIFPQSEKPYVIVTCHTEFKLPESVFYDKVVSVSNKARISQNHIPDKKQITIYNGVDSTKFYPAKEEVKNTRLKAVWSGRLDKFDKDVYLAIKENKLVNQYYDFYYYGSGSIDSDPLPNHYFMEPVSNNEMPDILRSADVFLYPTNCDSFGLALVEAMLCKLPCVVSKVVAEITGFVACEDLNDYSDFLILYATDKKARELNASMQYAKAIEKYKLSPTIFNYQNLYENV